MRPGTPAMMTPMKRVVILTALLGLVSAVALAVARTPAEQALMESAYLGKLEEVKRLVSEGNQCLNE